MTVLKRVYLAGPMRGIEKFNFPAFHVAARDLRSRGLEVASPAERDESAGFDPSLNTLEGFDISRAMRWDIEAILWADGVVVLPGWERSNGVRIELTVADAVATPAYLYPKMVPLVRHKLTAPGLIGLAGQMRSGKDTIGAELVANHGYRRIAFADKVKQALLGLNPVISGELHLKQVIAESGWEAAKQVPEVRRLLQHMGTEAGREIHGENLWTDAVTSDICSSLRPVVITDCRFPNEADYVHRLGGKVIRLHRDTGMAVATHPSESLVDELDADYDLWNNSTPEVTAKEIVGLIS